MGFCAQETKRLWNHCATPLLNGALSSSIPKQEGTNLLLD